jgi:hypothetical protein
VRRFSKDLGAAPEPWAHAVLSDPRDKDVEHLAAYIGSLGGRKEPFFNLWRKKRPQR